MEQQYLTEHLVSQMTGIKVSTLRNHRHRRIGLPYIKYGSMVRYKIEDVRRHLDEHRIDFDGSPAAGKKSSPRNVGFQASGLTEDAIQRPRALKPGFNTRPSKAGKRNPPDWSPPAH